MDAIQSVHQETTWRLAGASAAVAEVTKNVRIVKTGKTVMPLPIECEVLRVQGGGRDDPAWLAFFVDDATSVGFSGAKTGPGAWVSPPP